MRIPFKRCLLLLLLLSICLPYNRLWGMDGTTVAFKASLSGKIYRNFSFLIEEDIRSRSDLRQMEWFLTTGEVNYRINRYLKTGVGYMSLCKYKAADELRNRYYLYATGAYPVGRFTFSIRERFQSTYKVGGDHPKNYLRSMFNVSYKIGKTGLAPFAYIELFNDTGYQGKMSTDRIRFSAGSDYKLNKHSALQLYYRNHIYNAYDPVNYKQSFGLSYSYNF